MSSQSRTSLRAVGILGACAALCLFSRPSSSQSHWDSVPNPIRVTVEKLRMGSGRFVFRYTVENHSSSPITDVMIGNDYFQGIVELIYAPAGWNGNTVPPGSYKCPKGWTFQNEVAEEDTVGHLDWSSQDPEHAIAMGSTLGGFEVTVPVDDPTYEQGHWTVYLDSATEPTYSGALQPRRTRPLK